MKKLILLILVVFGLYGCEPNIDVILEDENIPYECRHAVAICFSKVAEGCSKAQDMCNKELARTKCAPYANAPLLDIEGRTLMDFQGCWDKKQ